MNFTATYQGQTFNTTSKNRKYAYAVLVRDAKGVGVARWTTRKDLADKARKEMAKYAVEFVAIVPVVAPATLPAGVFAKNGKLYGPVKALRSMVDAGTAKFTAQGDIVPA